MRGAQGRWGDVWVTGAQVLLLLSLCLWVHEEVVLRQPVSTDEGSYLFQAHAFADGEIVRDFPAMGTGFKRADDMMILDPSVGWVSRYSPGHALWLTPGVWMGWPYGMTLLAAAGGLGLLYGLGRELGGWRFAGGLVMLSPFFLIMHGTLMSHVSGFLAVCLLLWGYVRMQRGGALVYGAVAGLAWSLFFLNRTFSASLLALPFAVDALWQWGKRRDRRSFLACAVFGGTALLGPLLYLGYNAVVTGDATLATYLLYEPSEGLGFGRRHLQGLPVDHSWRKGWENTVENVRLLDRWLFGVPGGLVLVLGLGVWGWRRRWTPLLLSAPLCLMLGYVFFWFPGPRHIGPGYYFEAVPFLGVAALLGFGRLWSRSRGWRVSLSLAGLGLLCGSGWFMAEQRTMFREALEPQRAKAEALEQAPPQSLVFLEEVAYPLFGKLTLNAAGLASDPLVLYDRGVYNRFLAEAFPERRVFKLGKRAEAVTPYDPEAEPFPESMHWEAANFRHFTGRMERVDGVEVLRADAGRDEEGYLAFGRHALLPPGDYEVRFQFVGEAPGSGGIRLDVASDLGRNVLVEKVFAEATLPKEVTLEFAVPGNDFKRVEPRVYFHGHGEAALRSITVSFSK